MGKRQRRVSRLLEMVALLESGGGWHSAALAERFGVSRTQIYNDVRALRQAGVPVRRTAAGYCIDASFFLPSVKLTPSEVLSLLFPPELFARTEADHKVHRSGTDKLLSCLPEALRDGARELLARTSVVTPGGDARDEVMAQIREAVMERGRIAIIYSGRKHVEPHLLQIDPYGIAYRKHAWYVVGYSVAHREVRKFRISRIAAIERTPLHFTVPKDFSVESYFEGAWYVFGGTPQEIRLRFSPQVARFVKERRPHPGQRVQTLSDGTLLYHATVNNLDEVAWWIVQYGGEAVVEHPKELRDKVVLLAAGILQRYGVTAPAYERTLRALRRAERAPGPPKDIVAAPEPPPYGARPGDEQPPVEES